MIPRQIVPVFDNEEAEVAFWDNHDPDDFDAGPAEEIVLAIKAEKKKPVTVRLEPELIAELKQLAHQYGVPYQTLMRALLRRSARRLRQND